MEATLWNLEDKLNLTTQQSITFFICICSLVIGICVVTIFIRRRAATRRKGIVGHDPCTSTDNNEDIEWSKPKLLSSNNTLVKKVLTSTVRWSGPSKWEGTRSTSHTERVSPLLGESGRWQSHNSDSPVWQRPILMGEKCELPRFSGLILYDESGRPVHHVDDFQENVDVVGRTTLKDLLL